MYVEIRKEIKRPFIRIEMKMGAGDGPIDLQYLNETVDICRFFRIKSYQPVLQVLYKSTVEQGDYPTSCPIKKVKTLLSIDGRFTLLFNQFNCFTEVAAF